MPPRLFLHCARPRNLRRASKLLGRPISNYRVKASLSQVFPNCAPACNPRQIGLDHATRSSIDSRAAILFLIGGFAGGLLLRVYPPTKISSEEDLQPRVFSVVENKWNMVGAIPVGRAGNLTPDQETKLQEFWRATLKVFGVQLLDGNDDVSESVNGSIAGTEQEDATDSSPEKRKKRRNLFRRYKDKESEAITTDADDKYGQTKEFHQALATNTPDALRNSFWSMVKHDNPDDLLLRFLRARKWDVEKALVMLVSTMHWRAQEMHVDDDIVKNGEEAALTASLSSDPVLQKEGADFMSQLRLGKSFLHGTDREGRPICFVRVRLHKQGEQSEASLERFTVHVIETARLLLSSPVDTAAIVFDMTGFSMANMDYGPVKFMIKCFEANYPESLGVVLVHKSPWVFQGIWSIIKGWLDPVVAGKVHFTKNEAELEEFIQKDHIITELGGDESWNYEFAEPQPGENVKMADTTTRDRLLAERAGLVREFEAVTQEWLRGAAMDPVMLQKRKVLAERLRTGYWTLDPYVRARSGCDRVGIITEDGHIDFYPHLRTRSPASLPPTASNGNGTVAASSGAAATPITVLTGNSNVAANTGPAPAAHVPEELD